MSTLHPDYEIEPALRAAWDLGLHGIPIESVIEAIFRLPEGLRPERTAYVRGKVQSAIVTSVHGLGIVMVGVRDHDERWVFIERLLAD